MYSDRALADMLAAYRGPKARTSLDEATADSANASVLPSSTDLFYFYRQTLEQCAKLSNKGALFDLCAIQKKWLRIYAGRFRCSISRCMAHRFRGCTRIDFEMVGLHKCV